MSKAKHDQLYQDLIDLKLNHIAEHYREVLDDAARKNSPMLDVLIQHAVRLAAAIPRLIWLRLIWWYELATS